MALEHAQAHRAKRVQLGREGSATHHLWHSSLALASVRLLVFPTFLEVRHTFLEACPTFLEVGLRSREEIDEVLLSHQRVNETCGCGCPFG